MTNEKSETKGRRRSFSAEFKLEALRRVDEQRALGVPLTQIGRELGENGDMLRAWRRQAEARGASTGTPASDVFPGQGRLPSEEEEMRRLKRENVRLQQEVSFLKTAAAYFAKELRGATSTQPLLPRRAATRCS